MECVVWEDRNEGVFGGMMVRLLVARGVIEVAKKEDELVTLVMRRVVEGSWLVDLVPAWRTQVPNQWLSARMLPEVESENVVTSECFHLRS